MKERPEDPRSLPFCSSRCKMVDLGKWLGGEYAVPSSEPVDEETWAEAMRRQNDEQ